MKKNIDLKKRYDDIYKNDASTFFTYKPISDYSTIIEMLSDWGGLDVLEIGSGQGELSVMIQFAGAKRIDAIDYSKKAVEIAKRSFNVKNINFIHGDYRSVTRRYDAVVMNGVLEHFDNPFEELKHIIDNNLKEKGAVITASPSFINPRGYVWMTLQLLFDVPMSLTDLHFLCPFDFEEFAEDENLELKFKSINQDWGAGERTISDFNKRLRNALKDRGMDNTKVDRLLDWLRKAVRYHQTNEFSGATVVYKITKR
jgi:SAM-dependent methyltransferase